MINIIYNLYSKIDVFVLNIYYTFIGEGTGCHMDRDNNIYKRIWKLLTSMKVGMVLLLLIAFLSILGTIIPQGYDLHYYEANYRPLMYEVIMNFSLYDVYKSWWFIGLIVFLSVNLAFCCIRRTKTIIDKLISKKDLNRESKNPDSGEDSYWFGFLGSWLTHLGLLIIIIFFAYGKLNGFETFVYGIQGSTPVVKGTDLSINIEDFKVKFRDDFSVDQYISKVHILKNEEVVDSAEISVNNPMRTNNLNIYQNSTGWAINATLYKDGKRYKESLMYEGDFFIEDDQKIALQFVRFYPDFDEDSFELVSKSPIANHPVLLYALFYNGYRVDMNTAHMGESLEFAEYRFVVDRPERFTLLQITKDPGTKGALIGGLTLTIGIFIAMFINPKKSIVSISNDENRNISQDL